MSSSLLKISQTNRPFTATQTKEMTLFQIQREWPEQISRSKNSIFLNFRRCVWCVPTDLITNLLHYKHIRKGNVVEIQWLSFLRDSYMCIFSLAKNYVQHLISMVKDIVLFHCSLLYTFTSQLVLYSYTLSQNCLSIFQCPFFEVFMVPRLK